MKIVADSSSDVFSLESVPYAAAPLKILTDEKEYVDDASLDIPRMVDDLLSYSGRSGTACPGTGDWLDAFGDAPYDFCVTITSNLSGSYNSACVAKQEYEEAHPDRKVYVVDSLSAGPELALIIDKLADLINEGKTFEEVRDGIIEYQKHADLLFMLESVKNLANNGRVSKLVASAIGLLGIRLVGKASEQGTLEPLHKCRGEKKALPTLVEMLKEYGFSGGKVRIAHCLNLDAAQKLKDMILEKFAFAQIEICKCGGLCSFYAEKGGLLVGFEK
ncbi:MAG: DegV family protein [Lachnospiraceae bacterium]|nr:DegV family protein [Lachnospiraceae bacterium]